MNCWPKLRDARIPDLEPGSFVRALNLEFGLVADDRQHGRQLVVFDGANFRLGTPQREAELFAIAEPLELRVETDGPIKRAAPGRDTGQLLLLASGGLSIVAYAFDGPTFRLVNVPSCTIQDAEYNAMFAFDRWSLSLRRPDDTFMEILKFPIAPRPGA